MRARRAPLLPLGRGRPVPGGEELRDECLALGGLAGERPVPEVDEERDARADERTDHPADREAAVQAERHDGPEQGDDREGPGEHARERRGRPDDDVDPDDDERQERGGQSSATRAGSSVAAASVAGAASVAA